MGNLFSRWWSSTSTILAETESKDEDVYMSLTATDKDKTEKFIKDLENNEEYWKGLAARCNVNGKISKKTVIECMRGIVSQSNDYCTMLKEMEDPIKQSAEAYNHFEKLLNDPWMIKNHNDKVTKARKLYHDYWSLLMKTSTTVNKILVASKSAIKAIDSYDVEMKYQETPDMNTIDKCLERLASWNEACKFLKPLQTEVATLRKLVDEQRDQWKEIEQDRQGNNIFGAAWAEFVGHITAIGAGSSDSGIHELEQQTKCQAERKRCARENISKSIVTVENCLQQVSDGNLVVESDFAKCNNNEGTREVVKSISTDFAAIKRNLEVFNKACDECIEHVDKCQRDTVDAVNGKKKSTFFGFF